jgi:hypothetical protein
MKKILCGIMKRLLWIGCILWCLYIILATYPEIVKYNNIIAVQWCEKKYTQIISHDEKSYYGLYLYTEMDKDDQIDVNRQLLVTRITNFWQPYRIYIKTIKKKINKKELNIKRENVRCDVSDNAYLFD